VIVRTVPASSPVRDAIRRRMVVAWAAAVVFGAGACGLAGHAAATLPGPQPFEELAYYPSGQALQPATLGHAESAADLAWLRAVQYYGEHRLTDLRFTQMRHVFEILAVLSPTFESPCIFGAFALAQEGRDFAAAEQLMLEALERRPRSGRLAFELGFLYFVRPGGRDLRKAAEYFELAARLPGSPSSAARFAASARQNSGDLLTAYQLWSQVRANSPNRYLREIAEREIDKIEKAIATGRADLAVRRMGSPAVILR
jgi:TPR repeat protein